MDAETLAPLVEQGLSTRAIARQLDRSQTTVRYWIGKHGLSAPPDVVKTSVCEGCGASYEPGRNGRGRYCSITCHGLHRTASRYARWLAGDPNAFTFPPALRRAVEQRDGLSCAGCQGTEWRGRPIPLELEHRDGNSENNSPENLCMLCPNCHAQTPTYKVRNRGNGRHKRRQRYAAGQSY